MLKRNKIVLLILFLLLSVLMYLFLFSNNKIDIKEISNYKEINLSEMNNSVLINSGNSSNWDEHIREIGNIVYNPNTKQYLSFYSGHNGEYKQNKVFVGMAYSDDGVTWEKYGKVTNFSAEDPYVVLKDNTFYMFFEDKDEVPFRRISLAISQDAKNWTILKRGIINPNRFIFGWQSQDVSSPLVFLNGDEWIMLYEGRGFLNNGKIGYASSKDMVNWEKMNNPVFSGGSYWDNYVVPDDIIKDGNNYIISYHGYNKKTDWQSGLAISEDLKKWKVVQKEPISEANTVMIANLNNSIILLEESDKEIKLYNLNNEKSKKNKTS